MTMCDSPDYTTLLLLKTKPSLTRKKKIKTKKPPKTYPTIFMVFGNKK